MFDSGPGCSSSCPLPPGLIVGLVCHCFDGILVLSSSFQRRLDRVIPAAASSSHVLVVLTVTRPDCDCASVTVWLRLARLWPGQPDGLVRRRRPVPVMSDSLP